MLTNNISNVTITLQGGDLTEQRLKELRKALHLTQQDFAFRLGISRNNIATYEIGKSRPGDAVMALICREFNVNETWLRTGEGEMFAKAPTDIVSEVAEKLGLNEFEQLILNAYVKLPKQLRDAFCVGMREGVFRANPVLSIEKAAPADAEAESKLVIKPAVARGGESSAVNQVSKEEEDAVLPPKYTGDM